MALYSIESEKFLGISHSGTMTVEGESAVELSDEEVDIIVQLIKEKDTTDVDELGIEETHPDLYRKLDDAYYDMARRAEEIQWVWDAYRNHYLEYDTDELMDYCTKHCGFKFEYDPADYYLDDPENLEEGVQPEIDEDYLHDNMCDAFDDWLDEYLHSLSTDEALAFFGEHMNADPWLDNIDYDIHIPKAIINKARGK